LVNIITMNNLLSEWKQKIKDLSSKDLAELVGVEINMAQKYKRFDNLPRLDSAILIEDKFEIPARAWVDLKKVKEENC